MSGSERKKCSIKRKNVEPVFLTTTKHIKVENKTQPDAELRGGKKCSCKRKNIEPDFLTTTKHRKVGNNDSEPEAEKLCDFVKVSLEPAEREAFYMLLEDCKIKRFLKMDYSYRFSDQYSLAMAAIYFKKAKLTIAEYTRSNFYVALYLANLMEDDIPYYKEIMSWAIGEKYLEGQKQFTDHLHRLLARTGFRARVTIEECHQIFSQDPDHWLWNRKRRPVNVVRPMRSYNTGLPLEEKEQFTDHLHRSLARTGFRARVTIEECHQVNRRPVNVVRPMRSYNTGPNELCL